MDLLAWRSADGRRATLVTCHSGRPRAQTAAGALARMSAGKSARPSGSRPPGQQR
jgi:hypothetical protein